jgi:REP element-mobilizing transposase RayT
MYDPKIHHRRSIRWQRHDYSSPGAYYVTICVQDHRCLLGNVDAGVMNLNDAGRMVASGWLQIPSLFPTMQLDEHVVMPNHFHGIIQIVGAPPEGAHNVGAPLVGARGQAQGLPLRWPGATPAPTLWDAVGAFKSLTTDHYMIGVHKFGWPRFRGHFWQRNYYDHVIRDQRELEKIREYIRRNPLMWTCDRYNPESPVLVVDESGRLALWDET